MKTKTTEAKAASKSKKESKVKTVEVTAIELPVTKVEKTKKALKTKAIKANQDNLVEEVISKREVKYIYPEGCEDILAKKKFRQEVRNKIKKLESRLHKLSESDGKESKVYRKTEKELKEFKAGKVKVGAAV